LEMKSGRPKDYEESGLREPQASYSNDFEAKNGLRNEWRVNRKSKRK